LVCLIAGSIPALTTEIRNIILISLNQAIKKQLFNQIGNIIPKTNILCQTSPNVMGPIAPIKKVATGLPRRKATFNHTS
jgi:hypothetical protein